MNIPLSEKNGRKAGEVRERRRGQVEKGTRGWRRDVSNLFIEIRLRNVESKPSWYTLGVSLRITSDFANFQRGLL